MKAAGDRIANDNNLRLLLTLGALAGLTALAAGAFGMHVLKPRLTPEALHTFETGARYQMYNAFSILAAAFIAALRSSRLAYRAGLALVVGAILFSGTLYTLAFTGIHALHFVMPLAGIALVSGWAMLVWACYRRD